MNLTSLILLLLVPIRSDGSIEKPSAEAFKHRWQGGEQIYVLNDRFVTADLLTQKQLKQIVSKPDAAKATTNVVNKTPNRAQRIGDWSNPENAIQLSSYQERLDGQQQSTVSDQSELASEPKPDSAKSVTGEPGVKTQLEENKPAAADVASLPSSNGNKYASLKIEQFAELISQKIAATEGNAQLGEAARSAQLQALAAAKTEHSRLSDFLGQTANYKNWVASITENEERWQSRLENLQEPQIPNISAATTSEQLNNDLKKKQLEFQEAKEQLEEIEKEISSLTSRITKIPAERSQANKSLEKIKEQIKQLGATPENPDDDAALLLLEVRRRAAKQWLEKLDSEESRQEQGGKIDNLKRDYYSQKVQRLQEEIANWENVLKQLRRDEVRAAQQLARQQTEKAHWRLTPLAKRNEALVAERKEIVEKSQKLKLSLESVKDETESIMERRKEIAKKIGAVGLTGTNGMELVDLRRNLGTTSKSYIRIEELETELRKASLSKVNLNKEREELADLAEAVEQQLKIRKSEEIFPKAIEFAKSKRDSIDELITEYQSYVKEISKASVARKKLIDEINQTFDYIDENAIWIRSAEPVSISDFRRVGTDMSLFFDGQQWAQLAAATQSQALKQPYQLLLAGLALAAMIAINRKVKRVLAPRS